MKKYYNFIKEGNKFLNNLDDDDLIEKRNSLMLELKEINDEIAVINRILKDRKESEESLISKKLPTSVFDLNQEQFDFVFEKGHYTTQYMFELQNKYIKKLTSIGYMGFNIKTNQIYPYIIYEKYAFNKEASIKSIEFLGNMLKKFDDFVEFDIYWPDGEDMYIDKLFYKSNEFVKTKNGIFNSVKSALENAISS